MASPIFNVLFALVLIVCIEAQRHLNFTQLTQQNGYQSEEHTVVTEDGYVLTMFRINKGVKCKDKIKQTPVFFMPPLLATADTAVEVGPKSGLPYLISDACFDTWVGNSRGTYYGRKHLRFDPDKNKEFWDFCVDEMGTYDVPAMVDYVLNNTGAEKLIFIGFSQGGGTFFIMCSERPEHCQKIKLMIGLAPAARNWNTKSVFVRRFFYAVESNLKYFDHLRIWELLARDQVVATLSFVCQNNINLCQYFLAAADSPHPGSLSNSTMQRMLDHFPAGTSVKNMVRFAQSLRSKKFVKFDYGPEKNMKVYGHISPPEYNLTAANVPTLLITGKSDALVDVKDVKWLASKLPNVIETVLVKDPQWNHVDMFYSRFISDMIMPKVLEYLLRYDEK